MVVRYWLNATGITLFFDKPIDTNENDFFALMDAVEDLEGVQEVKANRYSLDASFGMLFEPEDVAELVLAYIKGRFGLTAIDKFELQTLMNRSARMTKDNYPMPEGLDGLLGSLDPEAPLN